MSRNILIKFLPHFVGFEMETVGYYENMKPKKSLHEVDHDHQNHSFYASDNKNLQSVQLFVQKLSYFFKVFLYFVLVKCSAVRGPKTLFYVVRSWL